MPKQYIINIDHMALIKITHNHNVYWDFIMDAKPTPFTLDQAENITLNMHKAINQALIELCGIKHFFWLYSTKINNIKHINDNFKITEKPYYKYFYSNGAGFFKAACNYAGDTCLKAQPITTNETIKYIYALSTNDYYFDDLLNDSNYFISNFTLEEFGNLCQHLKKYNPHTLLDVLPYQELWLNFGQPSTCARNIYRYIKRHAQTQIHNYKLEYQHYLQDLYFANHQSNNLKFVKLKHKQIPTYLCFNVSPEQKLTFTQFIVTNESQAIDVKNFGAFSPNDLRNYKDQLKQYDYELISSNQFINNRHY